MVIKALIFAAGGGTRIRSLTGDKLHKCLLELEPSKAVVENLLDTLAFCGVKEAVIVVGYLAEQIKERLGQEYNGIKITYVMNKDYATTNSGGSFYVARNEVKDGCWHFNADNVMYPEIVKNLIDDPHGDAFMCDDISPIVPEDGKCTVDEQGVITEHSKEPKPKSKDEWDCLTIGCGKLSAEGVKKTVEIMESDLDYWLAKSIPWAMCDKRIDVYMVSSKALPFTEVDEEVDLKKAREEVYPKIKKYLENKR